MPIINQRHFKSQVFYFQKIVLSNPLLFHQMKDSIKSESILSTPPDASSGLVLRIRVWQNSQRFHGQLRVILKRRLYASLGGRIRPCSRLSFVTGNSDPRDSSPMEPHGQACGTTRNAPSGRTSRTRGPIHPQVNPCLHAEVRYGTQAWSSWCWD